MTYHLAQVNIARMLAPIDSPVMAGFVNRLDEINLLAEQSEGFVWRLKADDNNATSIRVFEDEMLIVNLSVWENVEALHHYTYKTAHAELIKQRRDWFSVLGTPHMVLWWIHAGHIPSTNEAQAKLKHFQDFGATAHAFSFSKRFSLADFLAFRGVQ